MFVGVFVYQFALTHNFTISKLTFYIFMISGNVAFGIASGVFCSATSISGIDDIFNFHTKH